MKWSSPACDQARRCTKSCSRNGNPSYPRIMKIRVLKPRGIKPANMTIAALAEDQGNHGATRSSSLSSSPNTRRMSKDVFNTLQAG